MSDVISSTFMGPVVSNHLVKFGDPRLNLSQEIRPEAVRGGSFDRVLNFDNCQPEVVSDVISDAAVQYIGIDVYKF